MSKTELANKVRDLKSLKLMADELATEITSIEDEIKAEMSAQDATEMIVDVFKIRWTPVTTNRIDTKSIQKDLPEIAAKYMKSTTSRRFTIA